jgi:hypothetical protein
MDARRNEFRALWIHCAAADRLIQIPATYLGVHDLIGSFIVQLVQAALCTTITQRLPLLVIQRLERQSVPPAIA